MRSSLLFLPQHTVNPYFCHMVQVVQPDVTSQLVLSKSVKLDISCLLRTPLYCTMKFHLAATLTGTRPPDLIHLLTRRLPACSYSHVNIGEDNEIKSKSQDQEMNQAVENTLAVGKHLR